MAPKGISAVVAVAATQKVANPLDRACSAASIANRVLPTPGGPASTTPPADFPMSASTMNLSSSSRPTSGQTALTSSP